MGCFSPNFQFNELITFCCFKVLEQIRLPLISPSYLPTVIETLNVRKEHQGCQRFISKVQEQPHSNTARPRTTSGTLPA